MGRIEGGFIKIHRKILSWQWYSDEVTFRVFLHLLLTANYEPQTWRDKTIERGQVVTSISHLCQDLGYSRDTIYRALKRLETTGEIQRSPNTQYTIITVINYSAYQEDRTQNEHEPNTSRMQNERKMDSMEESKETKKLRNTTYTTTNKICEENLVNLYGREQVEKYKSKFVAWSKKTGIDNMDCITTIGEWMMKDRVKRITEEEKNAGYEEDDGWNNTDDYKRWLSE